MPDKVEKPKKSKARTKKEDKGVLAALPATRHERIGTRRASAPKTFERPEAARVAAGEPAEPGAETPTAKSATAKPGAKPAAAGTATAKGAPASGAAASRPGTRARARRKAAAPRTFEPTGAAESAAGSADEHAAGALPPLEREPRPRAIREGAPGMGTIGGDREEPSPEHGRPSGVELVTTAVQAAGELTQIGLRIGGRVLKRAVDRLPRP